MLTPTKQVIVRSILAIHGSNYLPPWQVITVQRVTMQSYAELLQSKHIHFNGIMLEQFCIGIAWSCFQSPWVQVLKPIIFPKEIVCLYYLLLTDIMVNCIHYKFGI